MLRDGLIELDLMGREKSGEYQSFSCLPLPYSDGLVKAPHFSDFVIF